MHGCHHNLSRHHQVFNNINPNSNNLGSQPNVPTSSSPRHSTPSNTSTSATNTANNLANHSQPPPTPTIPTKPQTTHPNGSSTFPGSPLTNDQLSLLQKGSNFAITPKYPPLDAYITATEVAAAKLNTQEAEEFRSDISRLLKQHQHQTQCNLNPAQHRALIQLKQDNTRVILTADKGVAMVVMDKGEYTSKAQASTPG